MWPNLLDINKEECKRILRSLEVEAYANVVSVLRAQGPLGPEKKKLLHDVATAFNISHDRHKLEVRRAVNDEKLNTIADRIHGPNTATEWAIEGRRPVPLLPRESPRTMYSLVADAAATIASNENARLGPPSETANKASEFPMIVEATSPETARMHDRPSSPSGVLLLPLGTAIPVKREAPVEEPTERKRRRSSVTVVQAQDGQHLQSPGTPTSSKLLIVPNTGTPGTVPSSILQKTLTTIKNIPGAGGTLTAKPVIYSVASPVVSGGDAKLRAKSITSIPKPRPSAIVVSNQALTTNSPQTIQLKSGKAGVTALSSPVTHLKTALQTTKHTVPIQTITGVQVKGQMPQTKILLQQKAVTRAIPKVVQPSVKLAGSTQKVVQQGGKTPPVGVVLQKHPGKGNVVHNLQVKTAQGYNVPLQLRAATGQKPIQLKHDTATKMVSSSGAKILPKPTPPLYMVSGTASGLSMVPRTIAAGASPRVMTVSAGSGLGKPSQGGLLHSTKPMQTVHVVQTPPRRQNLVVVQKGPGTLTKTSPLTPANKDLVGKVVMGKAGHQLKPGGLPSNVLAQSLQSLPVTSTQSGNVILLDLSSQESMTKNAAIAELLQASGLLGDGTGDKQKKLVEPQDAGGTAQQEEAAREELRAEEAKESPTIASPVVVPTLSIEEAVEMLNRSDTPETRAILSQAGIQISDEMGDSEEEEPVEQVQVQVQEVPKQTDQIHTIGAAKGDKKEAPEVEPNAGVYSSEEESTVVSPVVSLPTTHTTLPLTVQSRSSRMDIFSTALASADINLDNFMEEEDEPEPVPTSPKVEEASKNDQTSSNSTEKTSDPIEAQLAELTASSDKDT